MSKLKFAAEQFMATLTESYYVLVKSCPQNWIQNPYTKSCLLFVNDDVTQEDAVVECQNIGASLAILDSQEEMTWFFNYREAMSGM